MHPAASHGNTHSNINELYQQKQHQDAINIGLLYIQSIIRLHSDHHLPDNTCSTIIRLHPQKHYLAKASVLSLVYTHSSVTRLPLKQ